MFWAAGLTRCTLLGMRANGQGGQSGQGGMPSLGQSAAGPAAGRWQTDGGGTSTSRPTYFGCPCFLPVCSVSSAHHPALRRSNATIQPSTPNTTTHHMPPSSAPRGANNTCNRRIPIPHPPIRLLITLLPPSIVLSPSPFVHSTMHTITNYSK